MIGEPARVAIVTGAARGIGAATARALAADGYAVALLDVVVDGCAVVAEEINRSGGRALAVLANVTVAADVDGAVERVVAELGAPVVLVNNAGIIRDKALMELDPGDFDAVLDVNLRGTYLMSRAVCPHMVKRGWGRIVNLSSSSALGKREQVHYAAAKAGVQGFTRSLALELGPSGVTVNAVAPGFIVSDMTAAEAARIGMDFDKYQALAAYHAAVRRVGQPEDVADAIAFLASDRASFVSGQVLYVTGGPVGLPG
jgi:3-oxoacyl-[acyl-carrier protein] reductase